jgi:hypothetical protein
MDRAPLPTGGVAALAEPPRSDVRANPGLPLLPYVVIVYECAAGHEVRQPPGASIDGCPTCHTTALKFKEAVPYDPEP